MREREAHCTQVAWWRCGWLGVGELGGRGRHLAHRKRDEGGGRGIDERERERESLPVSVSVSGRGGDGDAPLVDGVGARARVCLCLDVRGGVEMGRGGERVPP